MDSIPNDKNGMVPGMDSIPFQEWIFLSKNNGFFLTKKWTKLHWNPPKNTKQKPKNTMISMRFYKKWEIVLGGFQCSFVHFFGEKKSIIFAQKNPFLEWNGIHSIPGMDLIHSIPFYTLAGITSSTLRHIYSRFYILRKNNKEELAVFIFCSNREWHR